MPRKRPERRICRLRRAAAAAAAAAAADGATLPARLHEPGEGRRTGAAARLAPALFVAMLLSACGTYGDFGRVRPSLVNDDIHAWVGREAATSYAERVSAYRLTEQERTLRDLAFPLIQPPLERDRFDNVLHEFGISRAFKRDWWYFDRTAYYRDLQALHLRTADGLYARLIEDVRNDVVRAPAFFDVGARVADIDERRRKSLAYVSELTPQERDDTMARIGENRLVVSWVAHALADRAAAYRYALERMVIATPSTHAVEAEQVLAQLQAICAAHREAFPPPVVVLPSGRVAARARVSK